MYKVYWADRKVVRTFEKLPLPMRNRVEEAISELANDPRPQGTRLLSGKLSGVWRLRVGDYRILYDIDDKKREVFIVDVGHRREVYR